MSFEHQVDFKQDFWDSFNGEKRLSELLNHFVSRYSDSIDEHKHQFADIIGTQLIGKHLDSDKLLEFVEEELSNLDINLVEPKEKFTKNRSDGATSDEVTIFDLDRLTGTQFEKFMESLLKENGYSDVAVTGKAGDQGGDILASKDDEKFIIQAKNYALNHKVSNTAVQEAFGAIAYYGADKGIVVTNSFFTPGAIELADVNNIELWDRRTVSKMLENYNKIEEDQAQN
jgi:hypothetical protein